MIHLNKSQCWDTPLQVQQRRDAERADLREGRRVHGRRDREAEGAAGGRGGQLRHPEGGGGG